MDFSNELSLEQEFKLTIYNDKIGSMSTAQSHEYLVEILKQMMIVDNIIKHMVKKTSF
nr:nblA [Porphyrostromium japonicum]